MASPLVEELLAVDGHLQRKSLVFFSSVADIHAQSIALNSHMHISYTNCAMCGSFKIIRRRYKIENDVCLERYMLGICSKNYRK